MLKIWVVSREENEVPAPPTAPRRRCDLEAVLLAKWPDTPVSIEITKGILRDVSALLWVEGLDVEGAWFETLWIRPLPPREGEREPVIQLGLTPRRGA